MHFYYNIVEQNKHNFALSKYKNYFYFIILFKIF